MSSRNSLPVILSAGTTIVFWGSAFAAIRAGLEGYSPAHLATLRFLVASLALLIYALLTHIRLPPRRDLPIFFLLGFLGFTFYNLALNTGEQEIPSGPAALLIQTVPIWTALLAMLFLGERLRPWGWLGIAISFSGALVIALSESQGFQLNWGAALIMMAAISSSLYIIIQKRMLRRYSPVEITTYAIWAATLLLLPFAFGLVEAVQTAPLHSTLAVVYLGIGPAALAYATWAYVLSRLPAGRASSFLYGVPVMAFLVAWVWLGETPHPIDLLGGALALGGVVVVNTLGRARQTAPSPVSVPPAPAP